jgi:hypothetical protein
LDKYLGTNETLYRQIGIYNYLLVNMHPGKLVSDCMLFWGETEFPFLDSLNNLLVNMVYRGRLLYFTDAMIPAGPDSLNWGFTSKNLDFCVSNEKLMWTTLIENKSCQYRPVHHYKFILEGPFTKDLADSPPGRQSGLTESMYIWQIIPELPSRANGRKGLYKILNHAYNP